MIANSFEYHDADKWGTLTNMKINEILKAMPEIQVDVHNLDLILSKVIKCRIYIRLQLFVYTGGATAIHGLRVIGLACKKI